MIRRLRGSRARHDGFSGTTVLKRAPATDWPRPIIRSTLVRVAPASRPGGLPVQRTPPLTVHTDRGRPDLDPMDPREMSSSGRDGLFDAAGLDLLRHEDPAALVETEDTERLHARP